MARLAEDLGAIRDERTGLPLVTRVVPTAAVYQGGCLDALPDLLIEWNDQLRIGSATLGTGREATLRVHSPKVGTLEATNRYGRSGDHRPRGFFVATGPGLKPARLAEPVSVMDFAPTLEAWAGLPPSPGDGRPIPELLRRHPAPAAEEPPCW
jgi:predicted AlkP superfamily phosphohydrolase/phosphomutase